MVLWCHYIVMALLHWCLEAMKGWLMSVIFNLECCEHKKGPVGPQTGTLAFNCLCILFCTPILSLPSTPHPPPLLTQLFVSKLGFVKSSQIFQYHPALLPTRQFYSASQVASTVLLMQGSIPYKDYNSRRPCINL